MFFLPLDVFFTSCFSLIPPGPHKLSHSRDHNTCVLIFLLSARFLGSKQQNKTWLSEAQKEFITNLVGGSQSHQEFQKDQNRDNLPADITSPGNSILLPLPPPESPSWAPDSWCHRCLVPSPGHQVVEHTILNWWMTELIMREFNGHWEHWLPWDM